MSVRSRIAEKQYLVYPKSSDLRAHYLKNPFECILWTKSHISQIELALEHFPEPNIAFLKDQGSTKRFFINEISDLENLKEDSFFLRRQLSDMLDHNLTYCILSKRDKKWEWYRSVWQLWPLRQMKGKWIERYVVASRHKKKKEKRDSCRQNEPMGTHRLTHKPC